MHLSLAMSNVLHQALSDTVNIIYQPSPTIFDHLLFLASDNRFYVLGSSDIKYHDTNALVLPESYVNLYSYNMYISNNVLSHVQNQLPHIFHINSAILIHSDKPNNLKKEDRVIINNKLWKNTKIFFHKNHMDSWQLNNKTVLMDYGVPLDRISYSTSFNNRSKDILIIGEGSGMTHKSLQAMLVEKKYSCDIHSLQQSSLAKVNELLNQYKICIVINNMGWIDALCAAAAGCCVLTTLPLNDHNISSIDLTPSTDSIIQYCESILANSSIDHLDRVQHTRHELNTYFNFDIFKTQINNILNNIAQREVFIL